MANFFTPTNNILYNRQKMKKNTTLRIQYQKKLAIKFAQTELFKCQLFETFVANQIKNNCERIC